MTAAVLLAEVLARVEEVRRVATYKVNVEIVFDGKVDEEFTMDELYAVSFADHLAKQCMIESTFNDEAEWKITVTRAEDDEVIYSLAGDTSVTTTG